MGTIKKEKLKCMAEQAIEKTIAYLETMNASIEHSVFSDDDYWGYQVGFYIYYDYGMKDYRIYASACNKKGFATRRERYNKEELCLDSDFVSALVDEYVFLMKETDVAEREYNSRRVWEEESEYSSLGEIVRSSDTKSSTVQNHSLVAPLPFEYFVTDELCQTLWINRGEIKSAVRKLVNYCKKERDHYIFIHRHCWWAVECVLTRVEGYEIGVRIRYDGQIDGGFCPVCRNVDGTYWQMETYFYLNLPDDMEFVERLSNYYVFLLALQRGLISTDKPIEKFADKYALTKIGIGTRGIIYI